MRDVLITGGAGYVGCQLVPRLLEAGYRVTVYDILFFGSEGLPLHHPQLRLVRGDVRDTAALEREMAGHSAVVHMACISNDPSFELDPTLSRSINYDCFEPMVLAAKRAGVRRFVYVSSSSVYGVSSAPDVTEDHPLVPLTDYNRFKGMCEPLLLRHLDDGFVGVIARPATICGYSPRMRLDLSVNILTNHAVTKRVISVFGGEQLRPNLHILDVCDLYALLLEAPQDKVQGETFNAGYENLSLLEIAQRVKQVVEDELPDRAPIEIVRTPTNDLRSYHINSDKVKRVLGYEPKRSVEDAVRELARALTDGRLPDAMDDDRYYNVRSMKRLGA